MCTRARLRVGVVVRATCRRPGRPTSAARRPRRRARASGAPRRTGRAARRTRPPARRAAARCTRLRTSGAATPAATIPQAVALIASRQPHWAASIWSRRRRVGRSRRLLRATAPGRARGARRLHERADDRARGVGLRVPLHAEHEAPCPGSSIASGSSSSVEMPLTTGPRRAGRRPDGGGTWSRARARPRRARRASPRVSATSWSAPSKEPTHAAVLVVAEALGQVLHERAAAGDVDQLHAAADAEHRQVALDRGARERDLEGVALGHRADRLGVRAAGRRRRDRCRRRRRASARRSARAPRSGSSTSSRVRREHQREPAGALHGLDVVARQQHRLLVPHAPARALERGADADHGPSHAPHHRINAHARRLRAPPSRRSATAEHERRPMSESNTELETRQRARRRRRRHDRAEPARRR